jgi:hypothetical protein
MAINHADGRITHVGLVLGYGGESYNSSMDVSSFFVIVWSVEKHDSERVYYGSNWDANSLGSYTVDATPEVRSAYDALEAKRAEDRRIADDLREYNRVDKGKTVKVVRGRKVPKGTSGLVFWVGSNQWGESCGFITATGDKHFTALTNVEVAPLPEGELTAIAAKAEESKAQWLASRPARTNDYSAKSANYRNGQRYGKRTYR